MKLVFCFLSLLACIKTVQSHAETNYCPRPVVIAVIDTGYGVTQFGTVPNAKLCRYGHADFTFSRKTTDEFQTVDPVPIDKEGHGTHIAGIIDRYARAAHVNYCIVILKYYEVNNTGLENLQNTVKAIKAATRLHADFINYSGGGVQRSQDEVDVVKAYLDQGGTFVSAAGNEGLDLSIHPFYPAMDDDRVVVVGNGFSKYKKEKISNYGDRVNFWENGNNVMVYNMYLSGTSQATAIHTGKMVAASHNICK
jgi:subtilisin family serine protease